MYEVSQLVADMKNINTDMTSEKGQEFAATVIALTLKFGEDTNKLGEEILALVQGWDFSE